MKTSVRLQILLLLLLSAQFLFAQPTQWRNISTPHSIWDFAFEDNWIWVATNGGLIQLDKTTSEQLNKYQVWTSGMKDQYINSIAVDGDGNKWLGSRHGGLTRFDGTNWENYYYVNTIPGIDSISSVDNIKIAPNGDIWFTYHPAGLSYVEQFLKFDGTTFSKPFENQNYRGYDLDSEGKVWLHNFDIIASFDGSTIIDHDAASILGDNEFIRAIGIDSVDHVWVGTDYIEQVGQNAVHFYRILKFDGTNWSVQVDGTIGNCSNIFLGTDGNLWMNTSNGVGSKYVKYDYQNLSYFYWSDLPDGPELEGNYEPYLSDVDQDGNWWMDGALISEGYGRRKLFKISSSEWTTYHLTLDNIPFSSWNNINSDCDANIWLTSGDYPAIYDGEDWSRFDFSSFGFDMGTRFPFVDKVTCDIWMADSDPVGKIIDIVRYDGTNMEGFNTSDYVVPSNHILGAHNGVLWILTYDHGIQRYENGVWTSHNAPFGWTMGNTSLEIFPTYFDDEGNTWFGERANNKLYKVDSQNNWQVFSPNNTIPGLQHFVFLDDSGMVWCKHEEGLVRFNGADWEVFPLPQLQDLPYIRMVQDHLHNFWIWDYFYNKVFYWDGTSLTPFTIHNSKINADGVDEIHIDLYGNVWFLSMFNLTVYNQQFISNQLLPQPVKAQGIVFFDEDQDGQFSTINDVPIPGQKVWMYPDSLMTYTNSSGKFTFFLEGGTHAVTFHPEDPFVATSPESLNFTLSDQLIDGLNFGMWTNQLEDSIHLDITLSLAVCNQPMNAWVTLTNHGLSNATGVVDLTYDDLFAFNSALPGNYSQVANTISWNYEDLPYKSFKNFTVEFTVPGVDQISEILEIEASAIKGQADNITSTAAASISTEVLCSYDPNDKLVQSTGPSLDSLSEIADPLQYTVRFQNSGNYMAFKVVVVDTLDQQLDPATLQIISSSAEMITELSGDGVLTFTFKNISLPTEEDDFLGSQGFVKYQIAPYADLAPPITIYNRAYIYFDYNPPIVTNTTENILIEALPDDPTVPKPASYLRLYPNPNSGNFTLEYQQAADYEIIDLKGEIRDAGHLPDDGSYEFSPKHLVSGLYFLKVINEEEVQTLKFVIR